MFKGNKFNKQYLNLNDLTKEVLDYDMYSFGKTRDGIVNKVLQEYMEEADASISLRLQERRTQLYSLCEHIDESAERLIEKILSQYEEELIDKVSREEKPVYNKREDSRYKYVRIQDKNAKRIYDNEDCQESDYYGEKAGKYIKAVLEEYAEKPFHERESIMLRRSLSFIQSAIDTKTQLLITTGGTKYIVRPYKIMKDEQNRYHYLVGKSKRYATEKEIREKRAKGEAPEDEQIVSFRISRIDESELATFKRGSGKITHFDEEAIKKKLSKNGVMFLLAQAETVRLKLTNTGYNKYMSRIYQRPVLKDVDGSGLYEAFCTFRQIHNYFFDFGEDIEIVSPIVLREAFHERYVRAASIYEDK